MLIWEFIWEIRYYKGVTQTDTPDGKHTLIAELPYNAQVTPYLKISAHAGERIEIETDDYMVGGATPSVRAEYITKEGTQEYESLGWMNGHEVHYTAPPDVHFLEVKYRETGYNADFTGSFKCDDPALDTLWEKARRTLYVTMRDNYMDCPDRERAQWPGDMVNEVGETFYVFDAKKGPLLAKKGIHEIARWQRDDHTLYGPVPSGKSTEDARKDANDGKWNVELPVQMLATVGKYGFWTYYWYTGDRQTIVDVYPHVRDYLRVWKLNDDGLVIHRKGDWDWEDWGTNFDSAVLDSAWYYLALQGAEKMAALCGQDADIAEWQAREKTIAANFNKKFWDGKEYRSAAYKGDTDDRANALAVVAGMAGPDKYPALREVFATHRNASPYMEKYVLEALYLMGAPDQAMQRMRERWKAQIDSPLTTLWEGWGIGKNGYGGGSYNHAWSGGALTALSQYAAGVAPEAAGFARYHVLPQPGALISIRAVVSTPKGNIEVEEKQSTGLFELNLVAPQGAAGIVGIPEEAGRRVQRVEVNGKLLWERGGTLTPGANCRFIGEDDHYVRFSVAPGKWQFECVAK